MVLLGLVLIAGASVARDIYAPVADARATFRVIDTGGNPITNALVKHCFHNNRTPDKERLVEKYTGTNGYVAFEGATSGGLTYRVQKDGYYESSGVYKGWQERWMMPPSPNIKNGRWQPWNPTFDVVLKQIKNPTSMYVKEVEAEIPVVGQVVGFDLEKGDWVSPHGSGTKSDFFIAFSREQRLADDFDLRIKIDFPNRGDGIQEMIVASPSASALRLPYEAPVNGYQTNWISHAGQRPGAGYFGPIGSDETLNYFYRVRTVLDENGKIKETYYGKVHGAFYVRSALRENPKIIFTYYLNPTLNDRNLEFDPEKNLFGGRDRFAP